MQEQSEKLMPFPLKLFPISFCYLEKLYRFASTLKATDGQFQNIPATIYSTFHKCCCRVYAIHVYVYAIAFNRYCIDAD